VKDLLKKMFTGWQIREASWDGNKYTRDEVECMIEACGGDEIEGNLIHLFDYWGNDIQLLAPHYGIYLDRDVEDKLIIREDIPPAPGSDYVWEDNRWTKIPDDEDTD